MHHDRLVSIPIGFSGSLQQQAAYNKTYREAHVSIPIGFSGSLQLQNGLERMPSCKLFQSLSGFLVRCNRNRAKSGPRQEQFQSLSGFLVRCNARDHDTKGPSESKFQSLSGFLVRCNAITGAGTFDGGNSFNPYRVFWFAATPRIQPRPIRLVCVSIPIGFSGSLQPSLRHVL